MGCSKIEIRTAEAENCLPGNKELFEMLKVVAVVQPLSPVWLLVSPGTAAHQAPLSSTVSRSLLKFMSIEWAMLFNHLILFHLLLLLPSVFPGIRVFSSESALHIRWPKDWSFSFSNSPSKEYSKLISFRTDLFDLLAVQGTLKSLLQHHSSKASILQCPAFFMELERAKQDMMKDGQSWHKLQSTGLQIQTRLSNWIMTNRRWFCNLTEAQKTQSERARMVASLFSLPLTASGSSEKNIPESTVQWETQGWKQSPKVDVCFPMATEDVSVSKTIASAAHGPLPDGWNFTFVEGKSLRKCHIHPHSLLVPDLLKCHLLSSTWPMARGANSQQTDLENKSYHHLSALILLNELCLLPTWQPSILTFSLVTAGNSEHGDLKASSSSCEMLLEVYLFRDVFPKTRTKRR